MNMNIDFEDDERASSVTDIRIDASSKIGMRGDEGNNDNESKNSDVTPEDLRKLSEYFQKSKEEIQKKVDSLLNIEFPLKTPKASLTNESVDPRLALKSATEKNYKGKPITLEIATALRELSVGSCVHSFSQEWKRAKVIFRDANSSDLTYGLCAEKNGTKGLILSIQAVLIKNLIKRGYTDINGKPVTDSEWRSERRILKPTETERKDVLIKTLSDILWEAGEKMFSCVVQSSSMNCFEITGFGRHNSRSNYYGDGVTERLHLYEFNEYKSLEEFIRKNYNSFQTTNGLILFLYSLILSRNIDKLRADLQGKVLIGDMEDCKIPLFNLVLTGYAVPYFHNGSVYYDADGQSLTTALNGIKNRSDVGLLYWNASEEDNKRTEVGSMLKTPRYPVWLSIMGKNIAVLFNTKIDLINNWRFELAFSLHFYTGLKKQENEVKIQIESREIANESNLKMKFTNFNFNEEEKEPEIFSLIKSKWPDCQILNEDYGKEIMALL